GDTLTPVSAFCKIQEGDWSFLFESVVGGERVGRYSFLGSGPFLRFQAYQNQVKIQRIVAGRLQPLEEFEHPDPLSLLEEKLKTYRAPHVPGLPRFCGGAVGYAGYDAVRYVERLPNPPPDDRGLPDLCFAFYDRMVIFDHLTKTIAVVAHAHVDPADLQLTDVSPVLRVLHGEHDADEAQLPFTSNFTPPAFEAAVEKCKEYIKA